MSNFKYGTTSRNRLNTCHPKLQLVFNEAIKHMDISILEGRRSKDRQDHLFATGKSQLKWPHSTHNVAYENGVEKPNGYSRGIDAAPYDKTVSGGIPWDDHERLTLFAGSILGIGKAKGIDIVWGCDWDADWKTKDHKFKDYPHFQLADHEE